MKLVVHELVGSLDQEMRPRKNTIVEAIRPHIYRHAFAAGSLKLQILDDSSAVIAESENVAIANIGSAQFFHGYVRFYVNAYLKKGETYTVRLIGEDGYAFSESAYCGWVNGYDLGKYPALITPDSHFNYPLDFEVWERTVK